MSGDFKAYVISQLKSLPQSFGVTEASGGYWIRCPFHKGGQERTPSCKVNTTNNKFGVGKFFCFSCRKHGDWNLLASTLKLKKADQSYFIADTSDLMDDDNEEAFFGIGHKQNTDIFQSSPWPPDKIWRGISGELLSAIGGRLIYSSIIEDVQLQLPVFVDKVEHGYINCLLKKEYPSQRTYFNSKGTWASIYLFPYDYTKQLLDTHAAEGKRRILFLTEGPRDGLVLLQNKIPTCSILGTGNWNDLKASFVLSLEPELIVIAFDNDEPGQKVGMQAFSFLRKRCATINLKWPEGVKDPAELNKKQLVALRRKFKL